MSWEVWDMTSKKSFFNLAIYLNNLKRFKWGSFLYGIVLFFAVPFMFLIEDMEYLSNRFLPQTDNVPAILTDTYIILPILFAIVVPTVAAVLIFHNVHSPKQSVFVHSLPVSRMENYISDVASGLTLMSLPVIVNGIILLIMSFSDYSVIMTPASVIYWMFLNLSVLFVMFSVASATAFLTGNAAVHIGLNVFAHILPMIVALFIAIISEEFLYGFMTTENFVSNEIITHTPIVWLFAGAMNYRSFQMSIFSQGMFWVYIAVSLALYVAGYLLYRVRKVELSGDVCAFSVFRPIFKYMATASVAIFVFAILCETDIAPVFAYIEVAVSAAIVYFACEMIINKSFKVFGSYKGLLVFIAASAAVLLFVANTSVFGYETRIPDPQDIESAAVHESYRFDNIVVSDAKLIENVRETHAKMLESIPRRTDRVFESGRIFYITYKLRDGKVMRRQYIVEKEIFDEALAKMFENEEYKQKVTGICELNIENINEAKLYLDSSGMSWSKLLRDEDAVEFMRAVEKDISELSYNELSYGASLLHFRIDISCTVKENRELRIFKESEAEAFANRNFPDDNVLKTFDLAINKNYKNTMALLREKGYYEEFVHQASNAVWLCKKPIEYDGEFYHYDEKTLPRKDYGVLGSDCVHIYSVDGRAAVEAMFESPRGEERTGKNYYVFLYSGADFKDMWIPHDALVINETDLPDYVKKYLQTNENL